MSQIARTRCSHGIALFLANVAEDRTLLTPNDVLGTRVTIFGRPKHICFRYHVVVFQILRAQFGSWPCGGFEVFIP